MRVAQAWQKFLNALVALQLAHGSKRFVVRREGGRAIGRLVVAWSIALLLAGAVTAATPLVDSKFELFVTDPTESIRFYEAIGFAVVHAKADGYSTLRSGRTVVALSPVPWWLPLRWVGFLRRPPVGTEIVFYTDRLDALRAELTAAGYSPRAIVLQSWGHRDFRLTDPDGYYVRLSEGEAVP